jgi:anti-anti-sigma factor
MLQGRELAPHGADPVVVAPPMAEIDHGNCDQLAAFLQSLGEQPHVVLDMGAVRFADSSALRVLLTEERRRAADGGSVRMTNLQDGVRLVFDITGLTDAFVLAD